MQTPQSRFTTYIIAGAQASLARVQAAEYVVPEADRQQAWHLLSFALKLDEAWPVTRELLLALAPKMEMAGHWEGWIPYLTKGIHCAQKFGDEIVIAEYELQIGLLYRLLNQLEKAHQWSSESAKHFAIYNEARDQARALNEVAWIEQLQQRYEAAANHVEQAVALLDDGDPELAMCYRIQGMIAIGRNDFLRAEYFHHKALQIFKTIQNHRHIAWGLHNIAYAIRWQNRFEEAIELYHQAIKLLEEIEDRNHCAIVQLNLGNALLYANQTDKAITYLHLAEHTFSQLGNQLQLARIETNLGLAYLNQNRHSEAQHAFQGSINRYKLMDEKAWCVNSMDGLAMSYIASAQYNKAIKVLNEALELLSKVADTDNYDYLCKSVNQHMSEAKQGQGFLR